MKIYLIGFFSLLLIACNTKQQEIQNIQITDTKDTITFINPEEKVVQEIPNYNLDTFDKKSIIINQQKFIKLFNDNNFSGLINEKENYIIPIQDYYHQIKILDINNDGFQDIRVFIFSNSPNQCENYLFDDTAKSFKRLENCDLDIQQIKGTDSYYSYNAIGCANMDWESHLSRIIDFELEIIGQMIVNDCDNEFYGIKIFKVNNNKKVLFKTLPDQQFEIEGKNNKFDFLKNYWKTHCKEF